MYIYEALSHMTLHSIYRTLIACYKENGDDEIVGAILSHPSCCSELRVDYSKYHRFKVKHC